MFPSARRKGRAPRKRIRRVGLTPVPQRHNITFCDEVGDYQSRRKLTLPNGKSSTVVGPPGGLFRGRRMSAALRKIFDNRVRAKYTESVCVQDVVGDGASLRCDAVLSQVTKGLRWMPWHGKAMKDVVSCDKPR